MATFSIEADGSLGTPTVEVLSPTRESLPVQIKQVTQGSYTAGFTPKDVGEYKNNKQQLNKQLKQFSYFRQFRKNVLGKFARFYKSNEYFLPNLVSFRACIGRDCKIQVENLNIS